MEERRTTCRYKISVAVVVRRQPKATASSIVHAKPRHVSTRGIYFTSNQRLEVWARVGLSLTLPLQTAESSGVVVHAKAKAERVEENPDHVAARFGVAAVIDSYDIVRPKAAT